MASDSTFSKVRRPVAQGVSRGGVSRRWLNALVAQYVQSKASEKPMWVHLPDRVWQRQSALLMSLHERDLYDGYE
jgi:hypothetical protein